MTNTVLSIPKPNKFSNTPKPTFLQYRPPEDHLYPESDFDRFAFECAEALSPYIRDLTSEGCFFDLEGGLENV